jgi:LPS O-antigen subunit length determinant protein (WzzB/FepE family)
MTENRDTIFKELPQYKAIWETLRQNKRTVIKLVGIISLIMLVYVLIMPQSFTSTVTLLPPQKEKSNMGLASLLSGGGLPMMDITSSFGFGSRPADLYVQVLASRTVAESLIVSERLDVFFDIDEDKSYRHAIEPLQESSSFEATKDGIINISVTLKTGFFADDDEIDSIKTYAAHLANQYVQWLDRVNREKLISKARQSREFIESELERTQAELDTAFNGLVRFQEQNKSVFLEKQMEVALQGATSLKDKLYKAQLELALKRNDFEESSRIIQQLEAEVDQLQLLYNSLSVQSDDSEADYYVPFSNLPKVAREMAGLLREVKTLEQVILFLNQQYYQDRVQEAKDTPTVQVLDDAVPAIKRTSPRRALWMVLTVLFSTIASMIFVLVTQHKPIVPVPPHPPGSTDDSSA